MSTIHGAAAGRHDMRKERIGEERKCMSARLGWPLDWIRLDSTRLDTNRNKSKSSVDMIDVSKQGKAERRPEHMTSGEVK